MSSPCTCPRAVLHTDTVDPRGDPFRTRAEIEPTHSVHHTPSATGALLLTHLPIDLRREIVRFIPRHEGAELLTAAFASGTAKLTYVRRSRFTARGNSVVWQGLRPSVFNSAYYGGGVGVPGIARVGISKGEVLRMARRGV